MSKIEWTDTTWNPVTGCDRTSPGCDNCYALTMAKRLKAMGSAHYQTDGDPRTSGPGFGVQCHPDVLDLPLRWRKPRRVFVNSMSDLFHPDVPDSFIARVFAMMACAPQHTFQVLTKRPRRMESLIGARSSLLSLRGDGPAHFLPLVVRFMAQRGVEADAWPLPNVWLGTSIESDRYAFRADHLRKTPAAVRFISAEPLLGPLPSLDLSGIDWLIVGGESGRGARGMHPAWVRDLRDRCESTPTAFFFKQWGEWVQGQSGGPRITLTPTDDGTVNGRRVEVIRVGKKAAGRVLDGRTWDEYPR